MQKVNQTDVKLKKARGLLKEASLDFYLVPLRDEYGFEYVAQHKNRLQWLTGFTGSNGYAVIGKSKAAVFTDGRYSLQIQEEVDLLHLFYTLLGGLTYVEQF